MLSAMIQSLTSARYPRRYIGRHRARLTVRIASTLPRQRNQVSASRSPGPTQEHTGV
jgi:hypothetical protein